MNQQTNLQKKIGIFLGIIVICGVLFTTFLGNQPSNTTTSVQTSSNNLPTTTLQSPSTKIITPTTSITLDDSKDDGSSQATTNATPNPTSTPVVITTPPVDVPKKITSVYKDGTYSATGSYMSPGGEDQIAVTLTLQNDIITSVSVIPQAGDRTSQRYQSKFISGYQQYVLGKNIASVNLTTVSGSSLTPAGFNSALAQIKSQAKA